MEKQENRYIIENEGAETARLLLQEGLLTNAMGGVFPASEDLSKVHRVLDIACGPGGWALELAFEHPEIEVVGIDISPKMIEYAQTQAVVQNLSNATFFVMDTRDLDFPAESFDFINARLLFAFMTPPEWPKLWQTAMKLLRSGGRIRWTEAEMPQTLSPEYEKYARLVSRSLYQAGQSFSPDGYHLGILPAMFKVIREVGYVSIRHEAYAVEASYQSPFYEHSIKDVAMVFKLVQPFLVKQGVIKQEELDMLYTQMLKEMESPDFCSVNFFLSVYGQKP